MMDLIAKYFFRFLHELTVSSFSVTIVFPVLHVPHTDDTATFGRLTSKQNAINAHGEKKEISA